MKIRLFQFISTKKRKDLAKWLSKNKTRSPGNIRSKKEHKVISDTIEEIISPDHHITAIKEIIITDDTVSTFAEVFPENHNNKTTEENIVTETIKEIFPEDNHIKTTEKNIVTETIEETNPVENIDYVEEEILPPDNVRIVSRTIKTDHIMNTTEEFSSCNSYDREEFNLTDDITNSFETEPEINSPVIPVEFDYLAKLIDYRLNNASGQHLPPMPKIKKWNLPVKKFLKENEMDEDRDLCTLLLIGLAPHAMPQLFDNTIQEKLKNPGDFPELGGMRGKNFRGFLPTGQTAIFLLAGDNIERSKKVEKLFWSDKDLAKKKILWLEELPQGEPVMSGKIIMALDYIDLFLFGSTAPPHFSTSFPAKKITTKLTSEHIVLSNEVKEHYKNLRHWITHNAELINTWDKKQRMRKGFRVLFYGPPGTGKTLTANVLGNEVGKDVYKIDLSMVVSKYIGETEKNLELLFARAEDKDWILFFDEADAIFGKRTGVRDAHDKYANQEVSYLLQRIEDYNGLVILATNMKNNIDDAFIRRFNDIVKFTIPNENERKEIWQKSFPDESDFQDITEHVKKYELTGGNIINVIHFAGIQALEKRQNSPKKEEQSDHESEYDYPDYKNDFNYKEEKKQTEANKLRIHLEDVLEGIKREFIKEGKPFGI